jgi:hypothetical protein
VLRYHEKAIGRIVIWALLILLASQAIAFVARWCSTRPTYGGAYVDLGATLVVGADRRPWPRRTKGTRFLLRFGTSRVSVWLGNVAGLLIGMTALLLGTLLLNILMGGLTLAMANTMPRRYVFEQYFGELSGSELFGNSLLTALRTLPRYILYTMEWTALFYLFACCLRRNRGLTILIVVGVPLMLMILTLIPAVRQAAQIVEDGDERQMMLLGVQWMKYLADAARFIQREWQTIQLSAALISLPLSYLCMRDTPQP